MIPKDVIFEILSWAPASSVVRFRWACKYWFDLITDPDFLKLHLLHHSTSTAHQDDYHQTINKTSLLLQSRTNPDHVLYSMRCIDVFNQSLEKINMDFYNLASSNDRYCEFYSSEKNKFWGSCNGLLYFYHSGKKAYFLWNPCLRDLKKLPATGDYNTYYSAFKVHGFGYDHTIEDYKVIRIVYYRSWNGLYPYDSRVTSVYTLGSNSWSRKRESIPLITKDEDIVYSISIDRSFGFLFNGALHWIMRSPKEDDFEIGKNGHGEIQLPDDYYAEIAAAKKLSLSTCDLDMCVLNGCLCISQFHGYEKMVVWMMKQDSWTKLFTMNMKQLMFDIFHLWSTVVYDLKLLKYHKDGEIIMVLNGKNYVVMYDPAKMTKKYLVRYVHKIEEDDVGFVEVTYIETLVSLNSGMTMSVSGSRTTPLHIVMKEEKEDQKHKEKGGGGKEDQKLKNKN